MSKAPSQAATTELCRWCGKPLDGTADVLGGRLRCTACGVASTHPRPTDAELEAAYSTWYRPDSGRFSGIGDQILRRSRGLLARRLDRIAPAGPALDVGAGDGSLLDALHRRGREATGLERHSTRPDVREGDLGDVEGDWAAIVFWHSLEHLSDPTEELERAATRLAPGGVLIVAVPNAASLQAQAFGDRWLALDMPRHLTHITSRALVEQLRQDGLTVARVSYWRGGQVMFGWLHGLVGLLPGAPSLYDAIRKPEARSKAQSPRERLAILAGGALLAPVAALATLLEVAAGRGGTVYVEARRV